jgi:hypothetical protein
MPAADEKLAASLKQAKQTPMLFTFVAKSATEGKLLLSKKTVAPKEVTEAKTKLGGGAIFRGRCFGEEGKMVFAVPLPPPGTLEKQVKASIQRDTGLNLQVEVRVVEGMSLGDEEAPADPKLAGAPPAAGDKAAVLKRLSALAGPFKSAIAQKGPDVPRMQTLFTDIKGLIEKQDFVRAGQVLDVLEPLVGQPQPPSPPPPPAAPAPDLASVWLSRRTQVSTDLKKALVNKVGDTKKFAQLFSQAAAFGDQKAYDKALAVLDQLQPLLQTALGQGPAAPPATPAQTTRKVGAKVAYAQLRLAWDTAKKRVHAELQKLEQAILSEFQGSPAFAELEQKLRKLDTVLERFAEGLTDTLDDGLSAQTDEDRRKYNQQAAGIIAKYRAYVDSDPFIQQLEQNPFLPLTLRKTLGGTLAVLGKQMEAG